MYVVIGSEAFIFHFECFEPMASRLSKDLNKLYSSFQARPPGLSDNPFSVPDNEKHKTLPSDQIPF